MAVGVIVSIDVVMSIDYVVSVDDIVPVDAVVSIDAVWVRYESGSCPDLDLVSPKRRGSEIWVLVCLVAGGGSRLPAKRPAPSAHTP